MVKSIICMTMTPEDQSRFFGGPSYTVHYFSFLFFFIVIMLNYFIQVISNYINDKKGHSLTFYIEVTSKSVGVWLNLALLKDN